MRDAGPSRLGLLLKTGAVFFVMVLVILSISGLGVISRTRDYLISDSAKRLLNLAEVISRDAHEHYPDAVKDQYYLFSVFVREDLTDLVLLDRDGRIIAGSLPPHKKGMKYLRTGMTPGMYAEVWRGRTEVSPIYKQDGRAVRTVCFPVLDDGGRIGAAGVATLDVNYIEDLTQQDATYFFLKSLISVFLLLVFFFLVKMLIQSERKLLREVKGMEAGHAGGEVSFVVDTFHSVVGEMKEKERGLKEQREKALARARSVESYTEGILRNIQSGVMTFDAGRRVKTANRAAEAILKMAPGETLDRSAEDIFGADNWLIGLVGKTLTDGKPVGRAEGEVMTADGIKWLGAGASPIPSGGGETEGVILVFTDITEVKELRERMELKERLTLIGEMSAGLAHELRNPMGVISGYADLLTRRLGDDQVSRDAAKGIRSEIKAVDEIISEFMNFSQPTELNIAEVDMKGLLEEAVKPFMAPSRGVEIELCLENGLPAVEGDYVLLRQAFANIIKNSMEAMPGGGRLTVSARHVRVGKGALEEGLTLPAGRYVNVLLSDTGSGIAERDLRRIFTPFFTTKESGTGLGLALVQKILVYHGGRVAVRSRAGGGTTFSVYLPAHNERTA